MGLTFAADWLRLREPFDHAARADALTAAAVARLGGRPAPLVVDLGCGRGSNLRFLQPRLPTATRWRLIDRDPVLLAAARAELEAAVVELVELDLRDPALGKALAGADLVTAAALIDLVDVGWLDRLVATLSGAATALLITGSVDGRVIWSPMLEGDAPVLGAYAAHQGRDKGFGAALGSRAPAALIERLEARAWRVAQASGDWHRIADPALQQAYLAGVLEALGDGAVPRRILEPWAEARRLAIATGASRLTVGHVDVFATSPKDR